MNDIDTQTSSRMWIAAAAIGTIAAVGGAVGIWYARSQRDEERTDLPSARDGAGNWVRMQETVRIDAPVDEVYDFWHDLDNLADNMASVDSVERNGTDTMHWAQKGPMGIWTAEWDAEIVEDKKNSTIAWRSTAESQVPTAGRVRFASLKGEKATALTFTAEFQPPAGAVGAFFGRAVFPMVRRQVRRDLYRAKHAMEGRHAVAEA